MDLSDKINSAEGLDKNRLESYFISIFPADHLFSHGLDHHRRVWKYAKELLSYIDNPEIDQLFIQKLLIACYLHDTGMAIDTGEKHGRHSRIICEKFLEENNIQKSDFQDVLMATEQHDNKDYSAQQNDDPLLKILSAADDLDAFGYIGIFRYTEIYMLRGTKPADLGYVILSNASNRIRYFNSKFAMYPDLTGKHQKKFQILYEFFRHYNRNCSEYQFGTGNPSGYCGVTEIIMKNINNPDVLSHYIPEQDYIHNDKVIKAFFTELMNELA